MTEDKSSRRLVEQDLSMRGVLEPKRLHRIRLEMQAETETWDDFVSLGNRHKDGEVSGVDVFGPEVVFVPAKVACESVRDVELARYPESEESMSRSRLLGKEAI